MDAMPKNPKQNEGIESGRDAKEPKTKGRDQIWARCQRTWNKRKGSNLGTMPENPNKNKRIEFGHDAREPEKKKKESNPATMQQNPKQK